MKSFDVSVQGDGAVAMSLALALSTQGLRVAWIQPADARSVQRSDVRTYALSARSVDLLSRLKVWGAIPEEAKTAVHDMWVFGDDGQSRLSFSSFDQAVHALAWIVDAAELERVLYEAVRFAPHVTAVIPGQPLQCALRAVADGRHAHTLAKEAGSAWTHRYGHIGVAARVVSDIAHAGMARQWFRSPDIVALLPFDRPKPGCSYGVVWSLPEDRGREVMAMAPAAFEHALMEATSGQVGDLQLHGQRSSWPLTLRLSQSVCGPGWVVLGDAAHTVHPLAGQGLNLGLADVDCLSTVLAQRESFRELGDEKLLRRYARQRWWSTHTMGAMTHGLQQLFATPHPMGRHLRNLGLRWMEQASPVKSVLARQAFRS